MKALFEYISTRIAAGVPEIKTIRMWNNQFENANKGRNEKAFAYPACFVEFEVTNVQNRAFKIKDYDLIVRFRFGVEGYKFTRLSTFEFCDRFDAVVQLMAPKTPSTLIFTNFEEVLTNFDEDFNNVEIPIKEYRTMYRSVTLYTPPTEHLITEHVITATVEPIT